MGKIILVGLVCFLFFIVTIDYSSGVSHYCAKAYNVTRPLNVTYNYTCLRSFQRVPYRSCYKTWWSRSTCTTKYRLLPVNGTCRATFTINVPYSFYQDCCDGWKGTHCDFTEDSDAIGFNSTLPEMGITKKCRRTFTVPRVMQLPLRFKCYKYRGYEPYTSCRPTEHAWFRSRCIPQTSFRNVTRTGLCAQTITHLTLHRQFYDTCCSGWTGSDCLTPVCPGGCGDGSCSGPGICECPDGRGGDNCEIVGDFDQR